MSHLDSDMDAGPSWSIEDDGSNAFNTSRSAYFEQSQHFGASSSSSSAAAAAAAAAAFDPFQSEYDDNDTPATTYDSKRPMQSSQTHNDDSNKAEPMTIRVDDPVKSSDGSYITYRVFTMVGIQSTSHSPLAHH
ncbi:hypothetical protein MBANPS3_001542 [Mucor bainieri]